MPFAIGCRGSVDRVAQTSDEATDSTLKPAWRRIVTRPSVMAWIPGEHYRPYVVASSFQSDLQGFRDPEEQGGDRALIGNELGFGILLPRHVDTPAGGTLRWAYYFEAFGGGGKRLGPDRADAVDRQFGFRAGVTLYLGGPVALIQGPLGGVGEPNFDPAKVGPYVKDNL